MRTNGKIFAMIGVFAMVLAPLWWIGCSEEDMALDPSDSEPGETDEGDGSKPMAANRWQPIPLTTRR